MLLYINPENVKHHSKDIMAYKVDIVLFLIDFLLENSATE